jgi:hypothetical protein
MLKHIMRTRSMKTKAILIVAVLAPTIPVAASNLALRHASTLAAASAPSKASAVSESAIDKRRRADFAAMKTFRPGFVFWKHVFTLPDGQIAFGSAVDGRLLVTFPTKGDWRRHAKWADPRLSDVLAGQQLSRRLGERREQVARLLEQATGPVLYNSTRGDALLQNVRKYGPFVAEWSTIYERFGVPAEIGLAQAILESGMSGTRRSEANAVGFCQWLQRNWKRLDYLSPHPIQGQNQTTQAPYCAAYLSVLATKYGSFIPAVSEHNAGGTNVGRTLINGEHLGAGDVRARYLVGSKLANDLRALRGRQYARVYQSYGPRSHLYAEMVFGNSFNIQHLIDTTPQEPIHAMRTPRAITLAEIVRRTGLHANEVRRFNPALTDRVSARAMIYLPQYVSEFGPDVAFWRRPASPAYDAVLNDFMRLRPGAEEWDNPTFAPVLKEFRRRFRHTNTEEGVVMDTVLEYAMDQAYTSPRRALLLEFRRNEQVRRLIDRGVLELGARRETRAMRVATATS